MRISWTGFIFGLVCITLVACQDDPSLTVEPVDLAGTAWIAESIEGSPISSDVQSTVAFEDGGRISGNTGCNSFLGTYQISDDRMVIGPLAVTKKLCPPSADEQERLFVGALTSVQRIELEDDLLLLFSDSERAATRLAPFDG